jgi:hypothetical protein
MDEVQAFLEAVHPILMKNIVVMEDGVLLLRCIRLIWTRRGQWQEGEIPQH